MSYPEAQAYALHKLEQKWSYLTLDAVRDMARPMVTYIKEQIT